MYSKDTLYILKQAGIEIHTNHETSPISLRPICKLLGIKYVTMPLSPNTCGVFVRSPKGSYITINSDHPYTRRRFSLGHEIGHHFLGHDSDFSDLNDTKRKEEVEANRFSASLLMPDSFFYEVHKRFETINEMAGWLRLSPISVAIRCLTMGLREWEADMVRSDYYSMIFNDEVAVTD